MIRAEFCERPHSGKLLALPISNNVLRVTNTLANYSTVFISAVKSFIILSPGGALFYKLKLIGQNLFRVFKSRCGRYCLCHEITLAFTSSLV